MYHIKQTCIALLVFSLLAPGIFLGITPSVAEARDPETIINDIVETNVDYAMCEYGSDMVDFLDGMLGGVVNTVFGGSTDPLSDAETQYAVPVNAANEQLKINTGKNRAVNESLLYKECILDPVAWVIKTLLINHVTQDMLTWMDNGFDGAPAVLRDPSAFSKSLARNTLEEFLANDGADSGLDAYMCDPFGDDVVNSVRDFSTQATYGTGGTAECSVDTADYGDMVDNGSVEGTGIVEAMVLAEEGNNPFSSFFNLQEDTARRAAEVVANEAQIANFNDGYNSPRCEYNGSDGDSVCTPGQLVSKQMDDWLGGGLGQLEVADEVSEVVTTTVANLALTIFKNKEDGLLGGPELAYDDANPITNSTGYNSGPGGPGGPGPGGPEPDGDNTDSEGTTVTGTRSDGSTFTFSIGITIDAEGDGDGMSNGEPICTPGLGATTMIPDPGDTENLTYLGETGGRPVFTHTQKMSVFPEKFIVDIPECDSFVVGNDGCRFEHDTYDYLVGESADPNIGLTVVAPAGCGSTVASVANVDDGASGGSCTPGLVTPPTTLENSGDSLTLYYHGRTNGNRPTWYAFDPVPPNPPLNTYPASFRVEIDGAGCNNFTVTNNGCRYEAGGYIVKESDVSGRGLTLVAPASCSPTDARVVNP